ncbi:MAG: hypothetical protein V4554_08910, partial [Pseudomonadota bacterium]
EAVSVFKLESAAQAYSRPAGLQTPRASGRAMPISRAVIAAQGKIKTKPRLVLIGRPGERVGGVDGAVL